MSGNSDELQQWLETAAPMSPAAESLLRSGLCTFLRAAVLDQVVVAVSSPEQRELIELGYIALDESITFQPPYLRVKLTQKGRLWFEARSLP